MTRPAACCLEINLHPHLTHKGHPSSTMVRSYMRSRWIEGAIIAECFHEEPQIIERKTGGFHAVPEGEVYALQASSRGGKAVKERRRRDMSLIYAIRKVKISQDEVDALAIAHECVVALKTGNMLRGDRA